jgi:hypothetical protein
MDCCLLDVVLVLKFILHIDALGLQLIDVTVLKLVLI